MRFRERSFVGALADVERLAIVRLGLFRRPVRASTSARPNCRGERLVARGDPLR